MTKQQQQMNTTRGMNYDGSVTVPKSGMPWLVTSQQNQQSLGKYEGIVKGEVEAGFYSSVLSCNNYLFFLYKCWFRV